MRKLGTWLGGDPPLGFSSERFQKIDVCEKNINSGETVKKQKKASKLIINDKELKTLRLLYSKILEFKSLSKLETYLINNNIKTRKGANYSLFSLRWILTNPVYAQNDQDVKNYFKSKGIDIYSENDDRSNFDGKYGLLTYNKTSGGKDLPMKNWIIAVGLQPGIISGKEWVAVQLLLEKNADKRYRAAGYPQKQTIASGLIKCKHCGSYMRPRNMDRRREDGTVNYRYYCQLKEKSRMQKCHCKNVPGEKLDSKIIEIIKETFVPNSAVYEELKKMTIQKSDNDINEEIELLEKENIKKQEEIDKVVEKLPYIDIDLIDMINMNLRKLKDQKQELEKQIEHIKSNSKSSTDSLEVHTAKNILKIIDNSFKIFDFFDLKTKRDIAGLFIESIYGDGDDIEINFLNTKIDEVQKILFVPTFMKVDNFLNMELPTDSTSKITFKKQFSISNSSIYK